MSNVRTLRVTGVGSVTAIQDKTRLSIMLKDSCSTYNDAVTKITESSQILRDTLMSDKCGFVHDDIKTISFDIKRLEKRYDKTLDTGVKVPTYVVTFDPVHVLKVEFSNDNKRLSSILEELCKLTVIQPIVDVDYFVSSLDSYKEDALKAAVIDAKNKAKVLAESVGVELGDIIDIAYTWDTVKIHSYQQPMKFGALAIDGAVSMDRAIQTDFVADDKVIQNTVNMVWSLV